ncbi:MAG: hypothetical protein ACYTA5_19045, partial [Planctomycetota bacterium]
VSQLLRELQTKSLVTVAYETGTSQLSDAIPASMVDGDDLVAAAQQGHSFRASQDGKSFVLEAETTTPVLQIEPQALDSDEVVELLELLGLKSAKLKYEITMSAAGHDRDDRLVISTRSLLGTLFYIAQAVEIPKLHRQLGMVTVTRDEHGEPFDWSQIMGDLIRIHSQIVPPLNAAVAIRYKDHWFYINEADLQSKATFALLMQMFELQAGKEATVAPVLTLPIGG